MADWSNHPITLHVGLPKCASTMLQKFVFMAHPKVQFLGIYRPVYEWDPDVQKMLDAPAYTYLRTLKLQESFAFDQSKLNDMLPLPSEEKIAVLSDEDLTIPGPVDRAEKARRLHASFPNASVLMTIRNPVDWVESWYIFEMRKLTKYVPFDQWFEKNTKKIESSMLRVLRYYPVAQHYAELFGKENMKITVMESLKENQERYIREICDFIGVNADDLPESTASASENVRMPSAMLLAAQKAPALYNARGLVPPKLRKLLRDALLKTTGKSKLSIPSEYRAEIENMTRSDLVRLEKDWNLGLSRFGYAL